MKPLPKRNQRQKITVTQRETVRRRQKEGKRPLSSLFTSYTSLSSSYYKMLQAGCLVNSYSWLSHWRPKVQAQSVAILTSWFIDATFCYILTREKWGLWDLFISALILPTRAPSSWLCLIIISQRPVSWCCIVVFSCQSIHFQVHEHWTCSTFSALEDLHWFASQWSILEGSWDASHSLTCANHMQYHWPTPLSPHPSGFLFLTTHNP